MNRSPVVIAATVAGLALTLGFRPHATPTTSANIAALTTGNANVSGAQTVVGSDQALAGGLGGSVGRGVAVRRCVFNRRVPRLPDAEGDYRSHYLLRALHWILP